MKILYMFTVLINLHKNGFCTLDDVYKAARLVDSNAWRSKKNWAKRFLKSKYVRGIFGDKVYLASQRKMFGGFVVDITAAELASYKKFVKALIKRTISRIKIPISCESIAKKFNISKRTARYIIKELETNGDIEVAEIYITVNTPNRTDNGFKREKNLQVNSLQLSNLYCINQNKMLGTNAAVANCGSNTNANYRLLGNRCGIYFDGNELWRRLGFEGPVDYDVIARMRATASGAKRIYGCLKFMRRYSGKQVMYAYS